MGLLIMHDCSSEDKYFVSVIALINFNPEPFL